MSKISAEDVKKVALLARLDLEDEKIQMGFFDHKSENAFDKNFFSMINPYLN